MGEQLCATSATTYKNVLIFSKSRLELLVPTSKESSNSYKAIGMHRLADLKSGLAMLEKLIAFEKTLMSNVMTLENPSNPRLSLAERIRSASG